LLVPGQPEEGLVESECRDRYLWVHVASMGAAPQFEAIGWWRHPIILCLFPGVCLQPLATTKTQAADIGGLNLVTFDTLTTGSVWVCAPVWSPDNQEVYTISGQTAVSCGYTISKFRMDGYTTFKASYYSCYTSNQVVLRLLPPLTKTLPLLTFEGKRQAWLFLNTTEPCIIRVVKNPSLQQ